MVKQYVLWTRFKQADGYYIDPTQAIELWYKDVKFIETSFNNGNNEFIGYVDSTNPELIISEDTKFTMVKKTPLEVVNLCNEWYPSEEENYFSLNEDGFSIDGEVPCSMF